MGLCGYQGIGIGQTGGIALGSTTHLLGCHKGNACSVRLLAEG